MSITQTLDELQHQRERHVTEEEMKNIFGAEFRSQLIQVEDWSNMFYLLFEEEDRMYLAMVNEESRKEKMFMFRNENPRYYKEIEDKELDHYAKLYEHYKQQLYLFDKIFQHKNYRLKKLFISE